jgi:predicted transcriptional regulator
MSTITVRIDDNIKIRLDTLAKATSRTKSYHITHAIQDYLEVNEWQIQEIKSGIKEAESGQLIDHEEIAGKWESRVEDSLD